MVFLLVFIEYLPFARLTLTKHSTWHVNCVSNKWLIVSCEVGGMQKKIKGLSENS